MSWSFPLHSDAPGRSRIFLYLGLTVVFLLASYQLVLNRELLGSVADWASDTAFPSLGFDSSANATENSAVNSTVNNDNNEQIIASNGSEVINVNVTIPTSTSTSTSTPTTSINNVSPTETPILPREKELVLAAMMSSNMSWVPENLPGWHSNIYRADASPGEADLTVPANRGNEAMVFLTYMIDRYDSLPDVSLFLHGGRYQWHNDNPLYDSVISIRDLQPSYVREAGYVNLRCTWAIGCPAELEPARYMRERPDDQAHMTAVLFPDSFAELFPDIEMPEVIGVPCCSQFALSRDKIRERPLEDYIQVRQWLLESPLDASITGRVFEYSWHIMFGKPAQFCLDARECFCNTYGYCNMTDDDLKDQWQWRGQVLPEGWPNVPEAPTEKFLSIGSDSGESNESTESKESEQSPEQGNNESNTRRRKRSLDLADEIPDISEASRRALREAAV